MKELKQTMNAIIVTGGKQYKVAEGDVDAAKAILQDRIDSGANDTGYPENAVLWQNNAQIQVQGNCLCLIALPDGYTIPENVFALG